MRGERMKATRWLLASLLAATCLLPVRGFAERQHVVGEGQSLARIARRYRVSVGALAAANGMSRDDALRAGKVLTVPARGVVYVRPGQTLARVARNHEVGVAALAKHNRIAPDSQLRVGQRLILPGFEAAEAREAAAKRWGKSKRPGIATLYRVWSEERRRVRLVDPRGRVSSRGLRHLQHLLRPRASRTRRQPPRRLALLLGHISDHFGGRPIHIVSGLRLPGGRTKRTSRHVAGRAIDFRIPGVPLAVLQDYCASFAKVGVGYYPNSHFIHLDVRESNSRWTDLSTPGQAQIRARADREPGEAAESRQEQEGEADEADDSELQAIRLASRSAGHDERAGVACLAAATNAGVQASARLAATIARPIAVLVAVAASAAALRHLEIPGTPGQEETCGHQQPCMARHDRP